MIPERMKAVVLSEPTRAEAVCLTEVPVPEVRPGWVLVKIHAFGMNHSEQILRQSEIRADYIKKPVIPGIECVGEIVDPSDSRFQTGQKVAALMGGMGRSFDGSYAEYALLPSHHVFAVSSDLPWEELAAVPETYFTAWGSLFEGLNLKPEDTLLVRGATCALGYAAIQIAKALGCQVIATTHKKEKLKLLQDADLAVLDTGILGRTGVWNGFDPIKGIPNGVYLTGFYSNQPDQTVMQEILDFLDTHRIRPCIGNIYPFSEIREACMAMEQGKVNGKIVVTISERKGEETWMQRRA